MSPPAASNKRTSRSGLFELAGSSNIAAGEDTRAPQRFYCKVKVPCSGGAVPTFRRNVPDVEVEGTSSSLTVPKVESCMLTSTMLPVAEVLNVPVV